MAGLTQMRPRDVSVAARAVFVLAAVASSVTVVSGFLPQVGNASADALFVLFPLLAVLVAAAWALRFVRDAQNACWTLLPFASIVLIVILDLSTADATVAAQVFFFFPALYGASQLPRSGALLLAGCCVVGESLVVLRLQSLRTAIPDCAYVCAVLITMTLLLSRLSDNNELLLGQLRRQAAIDPLTGLATRRVLDSAARAALTSSADQAGTALILIDIDRFKQVNDEYGHPSGDAVLVHLAGIIRSECRPTDLISRLGGDELAVLVVGMSIGQALERAECIRSRVDSQVFGVLPGIELKLSVSIGVAHAPTHAVELEPLYFAADQALYASKYAGRNQVTAHVPADV